MAETTQFELGSPEKLLYSEAAEMVVVPGTEGYFGVLPRHAPMISTLDFHAAVLTTTPAGAGLEEST